MIEIIDVDADDMMDVDATEVVDVEAYYEELMSRKVLEGAKDRARRERKKQAKCSIVEADGLPSQEFMNENRPLITSINDALSIPMPKTLGEKRIPLQVRHEFVFFCTEMLMLVNVSPNSSMEIGLGVDVVYTPVTSHLSSTLSSMAKHGLRSPPTLSS